jgi:CRP-like cAMP-binding protein
VTTLPKPADANIVSCDIVGHGFDSQHDLQVERIRRLNEIIRQPIDRLGGDRVVWAPGGDGGHLAFLDDDALPELLALMRDLRTWSDKEQSRLRVTAHRGPVSLVPGADGRDQLVGDGINLCGSLITFGSPHNYVVTSAFRDFVMDREKHAFPVHFDQERTLYLKHFAACRLYLMSFKGDVSGVWSEEGSDLRSLREARVSNNPWQIIYHTKRLLQVDSLDQEAIKALEEMQPAALQLAQPNGPRIAHPLLAFLSRRSLRSVIEHGELVERSDGDVICKRNDTGDSMFIVLRGEIGVVTGHGREQSDPGHSLAPYDIRVGEGGIVGELALGLNRPRTATLQSVGPTALLSINYRRFESLLAEHKPKSPLTISFETFLEKRILEHLYRNTGYLSLYAAREDAGADPEPWERLVDEAERLLIPPEEAYGLAFGKTEYLKRPGLYLLASGGLIEKSEGLTVTKRLSGESFDLVFADIPGGVIHKHHEYRIDPEHHTSRITIIWISKTGLTEFAGSRYPRLIDALRRRFADQMMFDVFISYAGENEDLAMSWRQGLEQEELRVYLSDPNVRTPFVPEIDLALAESRVLLPIITRDALESDWVRREIGRRMLIFDPIRSNILPVVLEEGLAERMELGDASLPPIVTGRKGEQANDAIRKAAHWIREVRDGIQSPPFKTV